MANIEDLRDRSVSSGTLKSEDLIPKFLGVLKTYGKDKYDKYIKENPEVEDWENLDEETMGWVVDELTDLLNEIAPDGCYFGASEGDGADFGFWSMSNESKKSESRPSYYDHPLVMVATANGKTIYSASEDGDLMTDDENEAYVFRNFDIISSIAEEDFLKVAKHYLGKNAKVDYIPAKGKEESKKSEASEDIWRGAQVVSYEYAADYIDLPAEEKQEIIDKYGEDYYDNPDAMDEYAEALDDYIVSMFDQDFVSIDGEEIPLGLCREPKVLIVQDIDHMGGDKAIELVKKLANGELTGSSDDGDYVAIMDGVNGSPHFDIYSEGGKSEGNDDDKGCKGKDCKDDKTKKNEADATFKVGDFVNYDAESDGKADLLNPMVYAEVSSVNDDGTLDLWVRDYDDGGETIKGADTQFCDKLDHFAGMTDTDHYYTDGRLNLYAGYYEIFITDKELGKPYVFSGTIDDLSEKDAVDIYYDTISFVDKSLEDECRDWAWFDEDDPEGSKVIDMSDMVKPAESKKSEADGNKDIFILDLTRIYADGDEEGLDDMQAAQDFYDEDEAIQAAKELADSYKDDDDVVQVTVMAGEQEKPNGDIVGDSFDIFTASSSDSATTAKYRKKANYTKTDGLDYYAKGGTSEAKKSEGISPADYMRYYMDHYAAKAAGWTWDDDNECYRDKDGVELDWEDFDSVMIDPIEYDGHTYEQVNVWGDGTVEFQDETGESTNWADFDDELVSKIYAALGGKVGESKKSEAAESEFIQDFRSYMDTMDGEPYSEDDLIGWGWKWVSEKEEYPNGTKTCATTYTMTDNGARYKLVVYWNSFMETIVGYELTQELASESKKSEGLPPKRLGSKRQYRSRADLINKMKQLGAVEITTSKQFNDIKNSQWLHTAGYALDTNGNLVAQSYYGDKDGKWYYTSTRNFDSDYLPESKQYEDRTKEEAVTNIFKGMKEWADRWSNSDRDRKTIADNLDLEAVQENMSDIVEILDSNFEWNGYGFKFVVYGDYEDDDTRDEADANHWNTCYGVCEEIADLIGIPDEGHVIGEMNTYFWEDIEAVWRDDESNAAESKKSEADEHIEFKQTEFPKELRKLYKACSERFYCEPYVSYMLESSRGGKLPKNEMTCDYTLRGSFGSDVILSVNMVYRGGAGDLTFTVTVSALDETTGYSWERLGDATARSFDDALNAAMSEVDKNLMPFAVKVRKAIKGESKKSESLSLKQKELKDMVRYGEAEDITTISDAEAKELRKKGIELVGVSRGTYGMNGALLRDNDGKKYAITARSSNLFYFV